MLAGGTRTLDHLCRDVDALDVQVGAELAQQPGYPPRTGSDIQDEITRGKPVGMSRAGGHLLVQRFPEPAECGLIGAGKPVQAEQGQPAVPEPRVQVVESVVNCSPSSASESSPRWPSSWRRSPASSPTADPICER